MNYYFYCYCRKRITESSKPTILHAVLDVEDGPEFDDRNGVVTRLVVRPIRGALGMPVFRKKSNKNI